MIASLADIKLDNMTSSNKKVAPSADDNGSRRRSNESALEQKRQLDVFLEGKSTAAKSSWRQRKAHSVIKSRLFQYTMHVSLVIALFFPDLWVALNISNTDTLDIILSVVLVLFLIEMLVMTFGQKRYFGGFFFWMDFLGAFSLCLDINYMLGTSGSARNMDPGLSSNVVLLRAARTAKLGARAGRISRVMRLLRWLPGIRSQEDEAQGAAKQISRRLMHVLSTRVSFLTIFLVMIVPMFSVMNYPDADYSLEAWPVMFTTLYPSSGGPPQQSVVDSYVEDFTLFYDSSLRNYHPYKLSLTRIDTAGNSVVDQEFVFHPTPSRADNTLIMSTEPALPKGMEEGGGMMVQVTAYYDFSSPHKIEASMSIALIVFVVLTMLAAAMALSNSVSNIVLLPLEILLHNVRELARKIFRTVKKLGAAGDEEEAEDAKKVKAEDTDEEDIDETGGAFNQEAVMLERVVQKLAVVSAITAARGPVDEDRMKNLDKDDVAVLNMITENKIGTQDTSVFKSIRTQQTMNEILRNNRALADVGLDPNNVNSWNFNPLELTEAQRMAVLSYIFFSSDQQDCCAEILEITTFQLFCKAAAEQYLPVPYHHWGHAVDVCHTVYRFIEQSQADIFLTSLERFSLLVSAICHDMGHPGVNNIYLVETVHELAVRYNDKSPLENMHCAKMFEICREDETNIFKALPKEQYKEVRKICIDVILHTDNVHHFQMVKDMQVFYQLNQEAIDAAWDDVNQCWLPSIRDVYATPDSRKLLSQLFMHGADIGNPCKPYRICRAWALLVLEEFFSQGDKEKAQGITVQMLNDRDKVNTPHSQMGFIEFLVLPLVQLQVQCFPMLHQWGVEVVHNMAEWANVWYKDYNGKPPQEEVDKILERIKKGSERFLEAPLVYERLHLPTSLPFDNIKDHPRLKSPAKDRRWSLGKSVL